jgi:hypothetical protein
MGHGNVENLIKCESRGGRIVPACSNYVYISLYTLKFLIRKRHSFIQDEMVLKFKINSRSKTNLAKVQDIKGAFASNKATPQVAESCAAPVDVSRK